MSPSVWYNLVDDTNGEASGEIPEDEWAKLQLTEKVVEKCNLGHDHVTHEATYRIPTKEELKSMRHYYDFEEEKMCLLDED